MARVTMREFRGVRYSTPELADLSGVSSALLVDRLRKGWSLEQAMCIPTPKQRSRGVVSNFPPFEGTGGGSTAQETPEITFPEKADS